MISSESNGFKKSTQNWLPPKALFSYIFSISVILSAKLYSAISSLAFSLCPPVQQEVDNGDTVFIVPSKL